MYYVIRYLITILIDINILLMACNSLKYSLTLKWWILLYPENVYGLFPYMPSYTTHPSTHKNNPTYLLTVDPHDCSETECFVKLEAPKAFHTGFSIVPTSG